MKKILTLLSIILTLNTVNAIPSDTIYKDVKSLYKEDLKGVIAFTADKGEQGVKYLFGKADTIVAKAYSAVSKGSIHTYQILKTQQLVKSLHHLFYFIIGILFTFVMYDRIKLYINDNSDTNLGILIFTSLLYLSLVVFNTCNFNEMLTGFMNPEYGAILEVIQFIKTSN